MSHLVPEMRVPELIDEYFEILDRLIEINKLRRKEIGDNMRNMIGSLRYIDEYCTIKSDIGRQTGKSEYVRRRGNKNTLVIVTKAAYKANYKGFDGTVMSPMEIMNGGLRGIERFETIFIEEPSFTLKKVSKDQLYNELVDNTKEQTFIWLGM